MKNRLKRAISLDIVQVLFIIFVPVLFQQLIQKGGGTVPDDALATLVQYTMRNPQCAMSNNLKLRIANWKCVLRIE